MIKNIMAICQKELLGYFSSTLAYSIIGIFWLISGFFFYAILIGPGGIIQSVASAEQLGIPIPPIDVAYDFIQTFYSIMGVLSLFILPILSMGLYAEERKRGTLELLATSPITNWVVALGKLLGVVGFFIVGIAPILIYEAIAFSAANPPIPPGVPLLAIFGLILLATSILSIGMFISSLTDSSILAAILTFTLVLFLWIIDIIANNLEGFLGDFFKHISLLNHYENLIQGSLNISSIILFLSYIFLGIFLTAQYIETLRFSRQ